jgi:hypothetical protein
MLCTLQVTGQYVGIYNYTGIYRLHHLTISGIVCWLGQRSHSGNEQWPLLHQIQYCCDIYQYKIRSLLRLIRIIHVSGQKPRKMDWLVTHSHQCTYWASTISWWIDEVFHFRCNYSKVRSIIINYVTGKWLQTDSMWFTLFHLCAFYR